MSSTMIVKIAFVFTLVSVAYAVDSCYYCSTGTTLDGKCDDPFDAATIPKVACKEFSYNQQADDRSKVGPFVRTLIKSGNVEAQDFHCTKVSYKNATDNSIYYDRACVPKSTTVHNYCDLIKEELGENTMRKCNICSDNDACNSASSSIVSAIALCLGFSIFFF